MDSNELKNVNPKQAARFFEQIAKIFACFKCAMIPLNPLQCISNDCGRIVCSDCVDLTCFQC